MRDDDKLKELRKETLRVGRPAVFTLGVKAAPPPPDRKQTDEPKQAQTTTVDDKAKSKAAKIYYYKPGQPNNQGTEDRNDGYKYRVAAAGHWETSKANQDKYYSLKNYKVATARLDAAYPDARQKTNESAGMSHGTMIRNRYGRY
jgi:hypothetical protein